MLARLCRCIFLALSWCAELLTENVTILIIVSKKVNRCLGLGRPSWKRRQPTGSERRREDSTTMTYTHSPESDFFVPLPPKKSSSSSSSSNSPPPAKPAPAPGGRGLGGAGVPFSLLPTKSESLPEMKRLFSDEGINRGLMSRFVKTACKVSIWFFINICYTWEN